ncbi:MAG: AAA family ATPase [Deltaproteobacteria bacterium]|nr:AAA family ATPase [Deltaproteobacteria bacterium]
MYEKFYGLTERPFRILPDPAYLYLSSKHRIALVYLKYGITNHAGFIVITGEIGTGKTTLIRTILRKLKSRARVASIFNTSLNPDQFLEMILREFEIPFSGGGKSDYLDLLHHFLIEEYRQKRRVVLIVDEAQNLSLETLEEIRLISNLQTEKEHLIQIVMVGQPDLRAKLAHPRLAQFAQRISVHYHLVPLDRTEAEAYVAHRLKVAGFNGQSLFSPAATGLIFDASRGIPRLINILCDAALVYGFADDLKNIDRDIIEQVIADKKEGGLLFSASQETLPKGAAPAELNLEIRLCWLEEQVQALQAQQSPKHHTNDKFPGPEIEDMPAKERNQNEELRQVHQEDMDTIEKLRNEKKQLEERLAAIDASVSGKTRPSAENAGALSPILWWTRFCEKRSSEK